MEGGLTRVSPVNTEPKPNPRNQDHFVNAIHHPYQRKPVTTNVVINGSSVRVLLDTGATTNVVDMATFSSMKHKPRLSAYNGHAFGFGSETPLDVIGTFTAQISANNLTISRQFLVVNEARSNILGEEACQVLGLVIIINSVFKDKMFCKYASVFRQSIGKYNKGDIQIHIDYSVKPIKQKLRRVPFHQRVKVEAELARLLELGIIEKIPDNEPTTWISAMVIVDKANGEVRLCNDSKLVNRAVLVERCLMLTPDDIRYKLNGYQIQIKWC